MNTVVIVMISLFLSGSVLVAQPGFSTIPGVHFAVKYQRGITEEEARKVATYLEADHEYLTTKLGLSPAAEPLEVRIYSSAGKYLEATGQHKPWRGAFFHRGAIHVQPVADISTGKTFGKDLSYELALALLDLTSGKGSPRWLREAFAVQHSGIMADLRPPTGTRINSFSDLNQDLQQYPVPPYRDEVLFLLGQTMRFFQEQFGEEKTLAVFGAFDGVRELEDVFTAHFGREFSAIEKEWAVFLSLQVEPPRKKRD